MADVSKNGVKTAKQAPRRVKINIINLSKHISSLITRQPDSVATMTEVAQQNHIGATGPPNPLVKAAEASNLPRSARARIGQTTDPVPEGKVLHAEPEHHFPIEPASHDVEKTNPKTAEELGVAPQELEKLQRQSREHVDHTSARQSGIDFQGGASASQKNMPSTHRGATNQQ